MRSLLATLTVALATTSPAAAQNLLSTPGFSPGFPGWTVTATGGATASATPCLGRPTSTCAVLAIPAGPGGSITLGQDVITNPKWYYLPNLRPESLDLVAGAEVFVRLLDATTSRTIVEFTATGPLSCTSLSCRPLGESPPNQAVPVLTTSAIYQFGLRATGAGPASGLTVNVETVTLTGSPDAVVVTPEPGAWALLGTGLVMIGGIAARRRRA
jgi:hypothetical protein